ncbi:unnamed protein product [Schistosoma turkestanicum]|nr:unnamed protein product [Schistosoma turkestanicum]
MNSINNTPDDIQLFPIEYNNITNCSFISNITNPDITTNLITSCLILATVIIFFGNLLVILSVATSNRLKRISDQYIASLAVADLLVSIFVLPFAIVRQNLGYWPFESAFLCEFYLSSDIFMCMASILNLCCISIDRYIAIRYPLKYITEQTRQLSLLMITLAWIIPSFTILPPLFGIDKHVTGIGCCYITYSKEFRIYSSVLAYFLPISLIGYTHIRIFYIIQGRSKVFKQLEEDSAQKPTDRMNLSNLTEKSSLHWKKGFDRFLSRKFRQQSSKLSENNLSSYGFNTNTDSNDYHTTDALSYAYSCSNYYTENNDGNKMLYFDEISSVSSEFEFHEPEPVDSKLQILRVFQVPLTENDFSEPRKFNKTINFSEFMTKFIKIQSNDHQFSKQKHNIKSFSASSSSAVFLCNHHQVNDKFAYQIKHQKYNRTRRRIREKILFKKEQKTVRIVSIVIGCFTVCWTPFFVFYIGEAFCDCTFSEELYAFVTWLGYLNSIFNPFIYGFYNKEYAKAFKQIVFLRKKKIYT